MPEPILYSKKLAAQVLSVSPRSIDYLIENGRLTPVSIGARKLIHRSELERFAKTGLNGPVA